MAPLRPDRAQRKQWVLYVDDYRVIGTYPTQRAAYAALDALPLTYRRAWVEGHS